MNKRRYVHALCKSRSGQVLKTVEMQKDKRGSGLAALLLAVRSSSLARALDTSASAHECIEASITICARRLHQKRRPMLQLDDLPQELLHLILGQGAHDTEANQRFEFCRSTALISRRFREESQRLLYISVALNSEAQLDRFADSEATRRHHIDNLAIIGARHHLPSAKVERALRSPRSVGALDLNALRTPEMDDLCPSVFSAPSLNSESSSYGVKEAGDRLANSRSGRPPTSPAQRLDRHGLQTCTGFSHNCLPVYRILSGAKTAHSKHL